jgi:hypothetical protein
MRADGKIVASTSTAVFGWANTNFYVSAQDTALTSGKPGFAVMADDGYGGSTGLSISDVYLGPLDRVAPNPVSQQSIGSSALASRVDLQWQGSTDDANGIGIAYTNVYRNGVSKSSAQANTFSDATVAASTSYTYQIKVRDFHLNEASTSFTVVTPAASSVDPRRTGIRPTGAYWGALGEQIDLLSGNLNYTLPLLKAQGRGGWGVGFNLTYNSQNWRQDPGGTWNLGRDSGYGYGWKLQAGSLTPYWSDYWSIHHYVFTDATGAEYRLDVSSGGPYGGTWTSKEGIYLSFDAPYTQRLYFPDGSFWKFASTAAATEPDAGTMYPTLMQDTNGNQVLIRYEPGAGLSTPNTSARITDIEDVRAVLDNGVRRTYKFTYASGRLASITNLIGTAEGYTFTHSGAVSLYSPWSANFGSTQTLSTVAVTGLNLNHSFLYDSAASLTKVTLPYGGYLRWQYANYTYLGSRVQPEVNYRYLSKNGSTEATYAMIRDAGDSNRTLHNYAHWVDVGGLGEKVWFFNTDGSQPTAGLVIAREDRQSPGSVVKNRGDYTWSLTGNGNLYVSQALSTIDVGSADQKQKKTTAVVDNNGNTTYSAVYRFDDFAWPARAYSTTFLTDVNYTSRFINNRPVSGTVNAYSSSGTWEGGATLFTNYYDNQSLCSGYGDLSIVTGALEHDTANYGTSLVYRGNPTTVVNMTGSAACAKYDITGNSPQQLDALNRTSTTTFSSNNAAPASSAMGVYTESMQWNSFLGLTQDVKTNNATTSLQYDSYARPTQTTSPTGAVTTFAYTTSPPTVTATTNGRWTKTTLDGLGRTLKAESGDGSGTKSIVDYEYDSCGCSPTGKLKRQSLPYAPGGTVRWTTYTYDGLGRTLTVQSPDGASNTSYAYAGNTVTVTDPAGK